MKVGGRGAGWFGVFGALVVASCGEERACEDVGAGCLDEEPPPPECPKGSVAGLAEACTAVGLQGCADVFVEESGRCRPTMGACAKGTIPKFDEGCVPVGIEGCAPEFVADDGHCRPAREACPAGTFPMPRLGCAPFDGPSGCGSGPWGNVPDGPDTLYVDAAAPPGGSGSKASPFDTIAAALAKVPAGGRIVLAAGEYDEAVSIGKAMSLVGRCASMVGSHGVAFAPNPAGPAIVQVRGAKNVVVEGVRLSGPRKRARHVVRVRDRARRRRRRDRGLGPLGRRRGDLAHRREDARRQHRA